MNPDFPKHDTAESITWTLKDSEGNVVSFKVPKYTAVVIRENGEVRHVDKDLARRIWKEYMDKGFRISNKCIDHDMAKFHYTKRMEESMEESIEESFKTFKDIHHAELQEARINPKKLYTDNWDNYALKA